MKNRNIFMAGLMMSFMASLFGSGSVPPQKEWAKLRDKMVAEQIVSRGIHDERVLKTMRQVPRHEFVPENIRGEAYEDKPLSIGHQQTISQPFIVALMTELLQLKGDEKLLEIGTGSGYQAAVLAELSREVYTIEIVEELAESSRILLKKLGYDQIHVRSGDGYLGWPEEAPFDGILVTASPDHIPQPLKDQLKMGGRIVIPVGTKEEQTLRILVKTENGFTKENVIPVRFVPMTGEAISK